MEPAGASKEATVELDAGGVIVTVGAEASVAEAAVVVEAEVEDTVAAAVSAETAEVARAEPIEPAFFTVAGVMVVMLVGMTWPTEACLRSRAACRRAAPSSWAGV